jgi:hypothetical protein
MRICSLFAAIGIAWFSTMGANAQSANGLVCASPFGSLGVKTGPIGARVWFTGGKTVTVCQRVSNSVSIGSVVVHCMGFVDPPSGWSNYGCQLNVNCGSGGVFTNLVKATSRYPNTYNVCANYSNKTQFQGSAVLSAFQVNKSSRKFRLRVHHNT